MENEQRERWQELCELAAKEQDPDKLFALTQEINRLLEEREARLKEARKQPAYSSSSKVQPGPQ